jgi:hypothetical protein
MNFKQNVHAVSQQAARIKYNQANTVLNLAVARYQIFVGIICFLGQ